MENINLRIFVLVKNFQKDEDSCLNIKDWGFRQVFNFLLKLGIKNEQFIEEEINGDALLTILSCGKGCWGMLKVDFS